ncbi:MAG: hypothetical protein SGJ05_01810 [bacterium]|nr:hypothetical protein [bacterium]
MSLLHYTVFDTRKADLAPSPVATSVTVSPLLSLAADTDLLVVLHVLDVLQPCQLRILVLQQPLAEGDQSFVGADDRNVFRHRCLRQRSDDLLVRLDNFLNVFIGDTVADGYL